ncbi:MAG: AhpC/TSA family protein [Bacteroidales bacterium]|jgi:thiol-disulfide isomerase/thioredoxin|nr:AhpC/TSA family protein [Bacteroidales bacterium]MBQ2149853.1 AhpC/TSA family protein [Bacteroidales bacterium]MBQ5482432.1 AhpC/TSA family protein [Bacteroidales bacterium]
MKRILFLLVLTAALVSCGKTAYTIDGIFTTDDGTEVYLIDLDRGDTLAVTSVQNGRFSFTGDVKEPCFVYVGREKTRVSFILEPGNVTADIDERTTGGTPMTDAYNAFHKRFYAYKRDQRAEKAALTDSVVKANPDNLLGAVALEDLAHADTSAFLALYRQTVTDRVRDFYLVRKAFESIELQNQTAPGRMFTDYTVVGGNPDGTDVKLSDYVGQGKYILLDHWASWCGPCKAEMPYIKKTWEAFAGDRFDVVSVAVSDKRDDTVAALARLDMPWHQILDAQKIPSALYGVNAIPHLILFAPDGTILKRGLRGDQIYETVSEILSAN